MPSEILDPGSLHHWIKTLMAKLFPPIGVVAVELGKTHSLSIRLGRFRGILATLQFMGTCLISTLLLLKFWFPFDFKKLPYFKRKKRIFQLFLVNKYLNVYTRSHLTIHAV
jgi:hypothetical protein